MGDEKAKREKKGWGGARPGAGKKGLKYGIDLKGFSVRVHPDLIPIFKEFAKKTIDDFDKNYFNNSLE
jgi:hypothetical protein